MRKKLAITGRNVPFGDYVYSNIIILLIFLCLPGLLFGKPEKYEFVKPLMGTQFRLVFYAPDDSTAHQASKVVFNRLEVLNGIMSDYLDGSEVNRLSALSGQGYWVKVSPDLYNILDSAQVLSAGTCGLFDVTIGPVIQTWRKASRLRQFPARKEVRKALRKSGYRYLELDRERKLVKLKKSAMRLDFGGIGKGYAADEAIRVLKQLGIRSAFVDAGGDLALSEPPPGEKGWRISVSQGNGEADDEVVVLSNCGIATSGATYRYFEYKGKKYSHIVDPHTGLGLTKPVHSTVIASSGTRADALATAVSVAGKKRREKIDRKFPDITVHIHR